MTDKKCSISHTAQNRTHLGSNIMVVTEKKKEKENRTKKPTNNQTKHRNSSLSLREIDEIEIRYMG